MKNCPSKQSFQQRIKYGGYSSCCPSKKKISMLRCPVREIPQYLYINMKLSAYIYESTGMVMVELNVYH
jgi:hypothetical protein